MGKKKNEVDPVIGDVVLSKDQLIDLKHYIEACLERSNGDDFYMEIIEYGDYVEYYCNEY